jgi:hypothetical protein
MEQYLASLKVICPQLTDAELAMFASRTTLKAFKKKAFFWRRVKRRKPLVF